MRLISLTVENFRCYGNPVSVTFNDLTALVGQNDVGKSTIMDALAIFFDDQKLDRDDVNKASQATAIQITCEFDQLPDSLVVDAEYQTTLQDEFLLSADGTLIINKIYDGTNPVLKRVEAIALHPSAEGFSDLLSLKKKGLLDRAKSLGVDLEGVNKQANAPIRNAIWAHAKDLEISERSVPLDGEGAKQVWVSIQPHLPSFALFKSDRASTDQDAEAQDPLKAAIKEAVKAVEPHLQTIQEHVEAEVRKIALATVEKLREMDPSVAETLNPVIKTKSWDSLFSTSITGDEGIPLNKRGSGVKRLVLLNFFRAKAERDANEKNAGSIIYAIEEPETSQHPKNQRVLLNALRELSSSPSGQIILTTHTPMLARYLDKRDIRYIHRSPDGDRIISEYDTDDWSLEISKSLGVLADHNVKAFIGVEGAHDINFLHRVSRVLYDAGFDVPNLEELELSGEVIFIPLGGSNLALWSSRLAELNRPEFHLYDRDAPSDQPPKYNKHIENVNARPGCVAVATNKRELENYLHYEAINNAYNNHNIELNLSANYEEFDDVPCLVAKAVYEISANANWDELSAEKQKKKEGAVKRLLNSEAVSLMTPEMLDAVDPERELIGWLARIKEMLDGTN